MIEWSDEAIEAAIDLWETRIYRTTSWKQDVRDMLDAAVQAQLGEKIGLLEGFTQNAWDDARAEALEEAARVAETNAESDLAYGRRYPDEYHKMEQRAHRGRTIAAAIRALKETKGAS